MQPEPGTMVTPNVRLLRPLRSGGMGAVWVGEHLTLDTQVAVKFISAETAVGEGAQERFRREARAAAQLRSPHVVKLLDHGVTDEGLPYIVMELLEGETLLDRLQREGTLSPNDVTTVVAQVCKALGEAHRRGTVHRDIKPSNLFLTHVEEELFVKVLDFGIAKGTNDEAEDVTTTGVMIGTLHYMSPEQMKDARAATPASDLFSLAVVAYHALTGKRPFDATTPVALWQQMNAESFTPVSELAGTDASLDEWFVRALRADEVDRFRSAKEMARALPGHRSDSSADHTRPAELNPIDDELGTQEFVARESLDVESDDQSAPVDDPPIDKRGHAPGQPSPRSVRKRRRSLAQGFAMGAITLLLGMAILLALRREPPVTLAPLAPQLPTVPALTTSAVTPPATAAPLPSASATVQPRPHPKHWPIGCTQSRRPCGVGCCMWDHGCEPVGCTNTLPEGARWEVRLALVGVHPPDHPELTRPLKKAELWLKVGKEGRRQPVFSDQPLVLSSADLSEPLYTFIQPNEQPLPEVVDLPPRGLRAPTGQLLCRGMILKADRAGFSYQVWLSVMEEGGPTVELCDKAKPL